MSRAYVTAARLAALASSISERDRAMLSDVARCNVLTGKQLRALHYADTESGKRLARMDLQRLTEARLLARLDRRIGGVRAGSESFVYALDIAGQRLLKPELRRHRPPWTPGDQHLAHALAVSQLYVDLACDSDEVSNGRLTGFDAEPTCWRRFAGPGGARLILKPDAWVRVESGDFEDQAFIEIDRSTESLPRIADKARLYLRYCQTGSEQTDDGVFPLVVWLVLDDRRADQIRSALGRLPAAAQPLFAVAHQADGAHQLLTGSLLGSTT